MSHALSNGIMEPMGTIGTLIVPPPPPPAQAIPRRPRCSAKVRRAAARALDAAGEDSPIAVTVPDLQTARTMREHAALLRFLHAWIVRAAAQVGPMPAAPNPTPPLFDAPAESADVTAPTQET